MKTDVNMDKLFYEAPETQAIEIKCQSVICGTDMEMTEKFTVGKSYGDSDFEE